MARRMQLPKGLRTSSRPPFAGWDGRIFSGLQLEAVAPDVRHSLAQALGAVGVEAEYLLRILDTFPGPPRPERPSPERGALLLAQLEAFAGRLLEAASSLELATQSFLTALGAAQGQPGSIAEPWWPTFAGYALAGEPLELRLRRCGYSYRLVVALRLGPTVEEIADHMALVLHALSTLPPAGTLPIPALAQGLYELADTVQGDVTQHLIRDVSADYPGLLTAIERLRTLNATQDTSLASDIAWAESQYAAVAGARPPEPGFFARVFGRHGRGSLRGTARWATQATQEWRSLIATLQAMQATEHTQPPRASAPNAR
jgi:hypothetical protein